MAAHQEHVTDVLHVAPWFGSQQVTASTWGGVSAQKVQAANVSAYWGDGEWQQGTDNTPSPSNYTTAFDALETLLSTLLEKKSLPNLERITFVGFSAGAQLLSRWAYFSSVTLLFRPADSNVHVRYIAGDPSSYVYLDELRPEPSCAVLESTGADHKCNTFVTPTDNATAACPGYNVYKYGLHFREPGDTCTCDTCATCNSYVEAFARNKQLLASVTSAFALQDLRFLLGNQVTQRLLGLCRMRYYLSTSTGRWLALSFSVAIGRSGDTGLSCVALRSNSIACRRSGSYLSDWRNIAHASAHRLVLHMRKHAEDCANDGCALRLLLFADGASPALTVTFHSVAGLLQL